jgi:ribosomal protein S8
MDTKTRQAFRLEVLAKICEIADFHIGQPVYFKHLADALKHLSSDFIVAQLLYLDQEGYIKAAKMSSMGRTDGVNNVHLESRGINLIERIENKQDVSEFERDFSKDSILLFENVSNSQIVINSQNVKIENSSQQAQELIQYFEQIKQSNPELVALVSLSDQVLKEIREGRASEGYLKGVGQALISFGISFAANYATPAVVALLGLPAL